MNSPKGVITSEIREMLTEEKSGLLGSLSRQQDIVRMSLSEFEQQDYAIEITVGWLEDTIWFVPRPGQVQVLLDAGVRRGRIWTCRELLDFDSFDGICRSDLESIVKIKATFGAEIVSVEIAQEPVVEASLRDNEPGFGSNTANNESFGVTAHGR